MKSRLCRNFGQVLALVTFVPALALAFDFGESWFAGLPEQVRSAPGVDLRPVLNEKMQLFLESQMTHQARSEVIDEVSFVDEDTFLLQLFKGLHHPPGTESVAQKFSVHCQKVICAAQEIYGVREGLQLLYLLAKEGMNASVYPSYLELRPWTAVELDLIIGAFSDYPPTLFAKGFRGQILHFSKPFSKSIAFTYQTPRLQIYFNPSFDHRSALMKRATIFHEIAHHFGAQDDLDRSPEWIQMSAWKSRPGPWSPVPETALIWKMRNPSKRVSQYGLTNPLEDFAESMVSYRYDGDRLKAHVPEKYEFMKKVFKGAEYLRSAPQL